MRALQTLYLKCDYQEDKRDEYVKDRFIPGLSDKELNAKRRGEVHRDQRGSLWENSH